MTTAAPAQSPDTDSPNDSATDRLAGSLAETTTESGSDPRVTRRAWAAVAAVATATFAMVTLETIPVGLLTPIGDSFHVSPGAAGLTVTLSGLVAAVTAALLPPAIRRVDRRHVLLGLLALVVVATLVSAAAPNLPVLLVSRLAVGVAIGGFWSLAASVAVRLVPPQHIPRATAIAFGGATVANVLGVPTATLLGGLTSWRVAFVAVALLAVAVAGALAWLLPSLPATESVGLGALRAQLGNRAVRAGVVATFLLIGAHWSAFTFVRPLLTDISGVGGSAIGAAQLAFGVAGVVGTIVAGSIAGRDARRAVVMAAAPLTAALALFGLVGTTPVGGIAILLVWGLAFGAVPVAVQSWILRSAPDAAEAATALNTACYNLAIAVGAAVGGVVVDAAGTRAVLALGAVLAALATGVVLVTLRPARAAE